MAAKMNVSDKQMKGPSTEGQGRAIFYATKVDVRSCKKGVISFAVASQIIQMTKALNDARKTGAEIQMLVKDVVTSVKVTPTVCKAEIKKIADQLVEAGGEDKRVKPKAAQVEAAPVIQRLDLVIAANK